MPDFFKTYATPLSIVALAFSIFSLGHTYFTLNKYELVPVTGGVYLIDKQKGTYTLSAVSSPEASYSFQEELGKPLEESVILKTTRHNWIKKLGGDIHELTIGEVIVPPKEK